MCCKLGSTTLLIKSAANARQKLDSNHNACPFILCHAKAAACVPVSQYQGQNPGALSRRKSSSKTQWHGGTVLLCGCHLLCKSNSVVCCQNGMNGASHSDGTVAQPCCVAATSQAKATVRSAVTIAWHSGRERERENNFTSSSQPRVLL